MRWEAVAALVLVVALATEGAAGRRSKAPRSTARYRVSHRDQQVYQSGADVGAVRNRPFNVYAREREGERVRERKLWQLEAARDAEAESAFAADAAADGLRSAVAAHAPKGVQAELAAMDEAALLAVGRVACPVAGLPTPAALVAAGHRLRLDYARTADVADLVLARRCYARAASLAIAGSNVADVDTAALAAARLGSAVLDLAKGALPAALAAADDAADAGSPSINVQLVRGIARCRLADFGPAALDMDAARSKAAAAVAAARRMPHDQYDALDVAALTADAAALAADTLYHAMCCAALSGDEHHAAALHAELTALADASAAPPPHVALCRDWADTDVLLPVQ